MDKKSYIAGYYIDTEKKKKELRDAQKERKEFFGKKEVFSNRIHIPTTFALYPLFFLISWLPAKGH